MTIRLEAVTFDGPGAAPVAAFWAALLGREVRPEHGAVLVPGTPTQVGLRFRDAYTEQEAPRQLHLHLISTWGRVRRCPSWCSPTRAGTSDA